MGRTLHLITCTVYLNFKVFIKLKSRSDKIERLFLLFILQKAVGPVEEFVVDWVDWYLVLVEV